MIGYLSDRFVLLSALSLFAMLIVVFAHRIGGGFVAMPGGFLVRDGAMDRRSSIIFVFDVDGTMESPVGGVR